MTEPRYMQEDELTALITQAVLGPSRVMDGHYAELWPDGRIDVEGPFNPQALASILLSAFKALVVK